MSWRVWSNRLGVAFLPSFFSLFPGKMSGLAVGIGGAGTAATASVPSSSASSSSLSSFSSVPSQAVGRVVREVRKLNQLAGELAGIHLVLNETDVTDIQADIEGPPGTPYEGGVFRCRLVVGPDFPSAPPRGLFLTKIFHPNVSPTGDICVNTLKKDWNPDVGFAHVFQVIRCLLIVPFPESALNEEASKMFLESYEDYARRAAMLTSIYAAPKDKSPATSSVGVGSAGSNGAGSGAAGAGAGAGVVAGTVSSQTKTLGGAGKESGASVASEASAGNSASGVDSGAPARASKAVAAPLQRKTSSTRNALKRL